MSRQRSSGSSSESTLTPGAIARRPALGGVLQPGDATVPGADALVILGHSYWKKRFNSDPSVVGRVVIVNGRPFTVTGVVPASFEGVYALVEFDACLPLTMKDQEDYKNLTTKRDEHSLHVIGRLKPGLERTQAQAAVNVLPRSSSRATRIDPAIALRGD